MDQAGGRTAHVPYGRPAEGRYAGAAAYHHRQEILGLLAGVVGQRGGTGDRFLSPVAERLRRRNFMKKREDPGCSWGGLSSLRTRFFDPVRQPSLGEAGQTTKTMVCPTETQRARHIAVLRPRS